MRPPREPALGNRRPLHRRQRPPRARQEHGREPREQREFDPDAQESERGTRVENELPDGVQTDGQRDE
jgi:hypothetical protein